LYDVLVSVCPEEYSHIKVYIGHAHELRSRPGKKTDKRDAAWIAELSAHGLIQPSFVPPPEIGALRM
jgi:transposase